MSYQGKTAAVRGHNASKRPVGLWQLNGNLLDSSGNGLTLSVSTGTARYSQFLPGIVGLAFDGATELNRASSDASLQITGDLTVELLAFLSFPTGTSLGSLLAFDGNAGTEVANTLYGLRLADSTTYMGVRSAHENGVATPVTYDLADSFPYRSPCHIAQVRRNNQYSVFFNGRQIGATSGTLSAPTGGTTSTLRIGGLFGGNFMTGILASVAVYNKALTSSEIMSDYNLTLGPVFGILTP